MQQVAYRLVPRRGTGFHFGRQGLDLEESQESFSSDSLFAALVSVYSELYDNVREFLEPFEQGQPPFLISSTFPYVGDLPLFPMPMLRLNIKTETGQRKRVKKIRYISPRIFWDVLNAENLTNQFGHDGPEYALQDGAVWLSEEELGLLPAYMKNKAKQVYRESKIWANGTVPRVALDRMTNASQVYQVGRTVFADECGLWVLAYVSNDEMAAFLNVLLSELGTRGIGGERSSGYGAFDVQEFSPDVLPNLLNLQADTEYGLTLSRYYPRFEEIEAGVLYGEHTAYTLVNVGGWMYSYGVASQRRRRVRMIEVGSVLNGSKTHILGQLVDVRPMYENNERLIEGIEHPVYRSGLALTVGVPQIWKDEHDAEA